METLHTLVKKSIDKRPRKSVEIKKILLIDNETNSALATALRRERYMSFVAIVFKTHGIWFTRSDRISLSSAFTNPIEQRYPTCTNVGRWQEVFRSFWRPLRA